jgi:hypothetical protein
MQVNPHIESTLEKVVNKTIIGALIILCCAEVFFLGFVASNSAKLNWYYQQVYQQFDIYTIPESSLRLDVVSHKRVRLQALANKVAQTILTFTPENYKQQREAVKKYFTPNMLVAFNAQFDEEREASFVGKQTNYQVFTLLKPVEIRVLGKRSINDRPIRSATLVGELKKFDSNERAKEKTFQVQKIQIDMEVEEVAISKTNPYGFVVSKYQTKILDR